MKEDCVKGLILLVVAAGISCAYSQPKEIIILRHAEEPRGDSIHLSEKGEERAEALVDFFRTNALVTQFGTPVALFAPRPKPGRSRRSVETLIPTSQALGLPIRQPLAQEQFGALARRILSTPGFREKTVVIVWPHSHIDDLAAALRVQPRPREWKNGVYDRAWVIIRSQGRVTLKDIPQGLLAGDSQR
jgi:broad specificity phosphatase PhoE